MPSNKSVERAFVLVQGDASKTVGFGIGGREIEGNGAYVAKAEAQSPPTLSFAAALPNKTYLVIALDLDAPFTFWSGLGPILHWIQPGLPVGETNPGRLEIDPGSPFIANYIGPAPPPLGGPHRYVFFLYEQPGSDEGENANEFDDKRRQATPKDGKTMGNGARMWASLDEWEAKLGLGEVVAMGWFRSN
ncbi:phosphatidylethanolamine-binding protein [Coniella lustricola]|uniref:Phosphatidylethanolamine-binding protein n=1 Tax=Coniella lustricola TaxID=2025994 RepID=A0A2T2ZZ91_9PEZI|nr:phosphatidylethanolamine-binding protein [Coniella lustricola]